MTDPRPDASSRFDALEMRIAHQDKAIAELNEVITAQWRIIDALQRQMRELKEEVRDAAPPRNGPEPPPQY